MSDSQSNKFRDGAVQFLTFVKWLINSFVAKPRPNTRTYGKNFIEIPGRFFNNMLSMVVLRSEYGG